MTIDEFYSTLEAGNRERPGRHEFGAPLTDVQLSEWKARFPSITLPADYLALLRRSNGARIGGEEGTAYFQEHLLPLEEVGPAGTLLNGGDDSMNDQFPPAWLGVGSNGNGDHHVILDAATGKYMQIDPIDPENPMAEMRGLNAFLDWLVANGIVDRDEDDGGAEGADGGEEEPS